MAVRLNVFIDGSWLYRVQGPDSVLAQRMEFPEKGVQIDFQRLDKAVLAHVSRYDPNCASLGERYLSTSVFALPSDFDRWPTIYPDVQQAHIDQTKRNIYSRSRFVEATIAAGYKQDGVFHPPMKKWILDKLIKKAYQEKQVDTTVVALLVRSALINPDDYHCVITGDSDILPAIRVAYPEYSENVLIATTHPDELKAEHRQTSYSLSNFAFTVPALYLQEITADIIQGDHVYTCAHCQKIFARQSPIPARARPCCAVCNKKRT